MGSTGGTFAIFSIPLLLMNDHFAQLLPGPMLYSLLGSNLRCMMICWQTCSFTEVFFFIVPATKEPENGTQCVCRSIYTEGYGQHQHKDMPEMGTSFDQIQFKVYSSLERVVRQQVKDSTFAQTGCLIDMVHRCGRCGSFPREWLDRHSWFGRRTSSRLEYIIGFVKPKTGAGKIVLGTVLIEFHQLYHHFEQGYVLNANLRQVNAGLERSQPIQSNSMPLAIFPAGKTLSFTETIAASRHGMVDFQVRASSECD